MKLKYYLRGMGIGIIVTTIILAISFSQRKVELSDEQIMTRAAALGMVMAEEQETDTAIQEMQTETEQAVVSDVTEDTEDTGDTAATESQTTENSETEMQDDLAMQNGTYRLIIHKGDVCRVVCETLQANGVIDDAEALRKYLFELGYANNISVGAYDVPYGLTMEEVAQIIVSGPIE